MRAAALLAQLTFFTQTVAEPAPRTAAQNTKASSRGFARGRRTAKRRLSKRLRTAIVMVLGAVFHFIKRVFHLIIGLIRLTYRKVSSQLTAWVMPQ